MKRMFFLVFVVLLTLAACRDGRVVPAATPVSPRASVERPPLQVALLGNTSGGDGLAAQHAMEGAQLAFDLANSEGELPVDVMGVATDTEEDRELTALAVQAAAADPSYVAIIGWPSPVEETALAEAAAEGGLPFINVSPVEPLRQMVEGVPGWTRMVATDAVQAQELARYIARVVGPDTACVAADDEPRGLTLMRSVRRGLVELGVRVALARAVSPGLEYYTSLADAVGVSGCGVLFWGGGGTDGGVIRAELSEIGLEGVRMVGTDRLIGEAFIEAADPTGEGTVTEEGTLASCPCADVSTRTDLAAQRFVQSYQFRYGTAPPPFAAEGWDAAQSILAAVRAGNTDGASIAEYLAGQRSFEGLGGNYVFRPSDGELSSGKVLLFEQMQGRWVLLGSSRDVIPPRHPRSR